MLIRTAIHFEFLCILGSAFCDFGPVAGNPGRVYFPKQREDICVHHSLSLSYPPPNMGFSGDVLGLRQSIVPSRPPLPCDLGNQCIGSFIFSKDKGYEKACSCVLGPNANYVSRSDDKGCCYSVKWQLL